MTKTIKIVLIIGGIILVIFLGSLYFSSSSSTESTLVSSNSTSRGSVDATADTNDATAFLSTLLSLNKIKIDGSLFKSPIFAKLQDNTVSIQNDGVIGRPNPFAQIYGESPTDTTIAFPQINIGVSTSTTTPSH